MFVGGEFVKLFEPGDYFGEMALLTGEPRNATIRSQGNCACLALKGEDSERRTLERRAWHHHLHFSHPRSFLRSRYSTGEDWEAILGKYNELAASVPHLGLAAPAEHLEEVRLGLEGPPSIRSAIPGVGLDGFVQAVRHAEEKRAPAPLRSREVPTRAKQGRAPRRCAAL